MFLPASQFFLRCVVVPVPPPPEVGRLIALQRQPPKNFEHVIPRTVHDAFWQMHSEQQDYLVMYSYGSDRCGITLVTDYSLIGRIRQAFRRQEAECHRSAVEDAFKRRIARPLLSPNLEMTTIFQSSLIKATHLTLFIESRLSRNTGDMALQDSMNRKIAAQNGREVTSNSWRFCVYTALSPLYRVPLFSHTRTQEKGSKKWVANPTCALLHYPQRWKRLRDFLEELLAATGPPHPHLFQITSVKSTDNPLYSHDKIREALKHVIDIASILFVLTHLFQRAPPLLVATSIKRKSHAGSQLEPLNTVEDLLLHMNTHAHHLLLEDILDMSLFDQHLDQELRTYLQQFCPEYFREKQFLSVIKTLTISQAPMDLSFCNLKLDKAKKRISLTVDECNSYQTKIQQEMSDKESVLLQGNFDAARVDADMKLCALLLGYNSDLELTSSAVVPQFWRDPDLVKVHPTAVTLASLLRPWQNCMLELPNQAVKKHIDFPFLFQAPVKFVCQQICRIRLLLSQGRLNDDITSSTSALDNLKVSQIYKASLEQLLSMAFHQKLALAKINPSLVAVGSSLYQDAVEAALSLNDTKCTEMCVGC